LTLYSEMCSFQQNGSIKTLIATGKGIIRISYLKCATNLEWGKLFLVFTRASTPFLTCWKLLQC